MIIKTIKCDRCGKEDIYHDNYKKNDLLTVDLCDSCLLEFSKWFTNKTPNTIDKFNARQAKKKDVPSEDPKTQERIDLENKMNNAYARGNDRLGDSIAERLENENRSISTGSKDEKSSTRPYTRLFKFKSISSRDAFIYKYEKRFTPYPSFWYFKSHTRLTWESKYDDIIREQLENGYCVDPSNKLYVQIRITKSQFKTISGLFYMNHIGKGFNDVEYIEK